MRIISRDEFMKMPGTIFYRKITEPWAIETLSVRPFWDSEHDFITMQVGEIDSQDSGDWDDKLTSMAEAGASLPMTGDYFGRDGMFERNAKFLILEPADLLLLKKMIDAALPQQQPFAHPAFPYENPRTPAETEAMLNHMADVHLTPTAEKLK